MASTVVQPAALASGPVTSGQPEPAVFVIFGATGDLAQRMLLPALYRLVRDRVVSDNFAVVGFARRGMSHDEFREFTKDALNKFLGSVEEEGLQRTAPGLYYACGESPEATDYQALCTLLPEVEREHGTQGNRIFSLPAPPSTYEEILTTLGKTGLVRRGQPQGAVSRIVIEKPFGHDQ